MKKSLALTAILGTAALLLAACGNEPTPVDPTPADPTPTTEVPVAAGKTTIYFELAADSIVPESYASIYLAGAMTGWSTGLAAPVFTNLSGSKIYYVQLDTPADVTTWQNNGKYDYQLVLGYNESSNMGASVLGLQWNNAYKCDQETSGTDNPYFEWDGKAQTISLGTKKFSTQVAAPAKPLSNVTVSVTLTEALPAVYRVYLPGSWNGWGTPASDSLATSKDGIVWTLTFASIYADTYEFQILAELVGTETLTWSIKSEANNAIGGGNLKLTIVDDDANHTVDVLSGDKTSFKFAG